MNKRYAKGRRFEYRVRQYFEKNGFVVFRLAGSKPFDLLAFKPGERPLFIECKAKPVFDKKQAAFLIDLASRCNANLVLALNKRRRIVLKTPAPPVCSFSRNNEAP
ncbi:MAG: hypothetical protein QXT26_06415 [Thermoproteota archaeon]